MDALAPPPVCRSFAALPLPADVPWLRLVGGLRAGSRFWWLDSSLPGPRLGRYSFAGCDPWFELTATDADLELEVLRPLPGLVVPRLRDDPWQALRALLALPAAGAVPASQPPPPVPFGGGAIVALGYELAGRLHGIPAAGANHPAQPDLVALGVDGLYAHDHLEGRSYALATGWGESSEQAQRNAQARCRELRAQLPDGAPPPGVPDAAGVPLPNIREAGFDAETHGKAVDRIREQIAAGQVYQACLTHQIAVPFAGDPWALHGALRQLNPAPFAAYLELPGQTLVSCSPERFLCLGRDGWAESRPIKGTRPRSADPQEDRRLGAALRASEKDRAENVMIVDLVRNDLGRVCETGSIHVPELFGVEPYASVFQLVSTVRGRLAPGCDAVDLIRAAFPPGSMTGAPKLAAMALLARLETVRRGLYAGAVGYLDAAGGADLSVVIRSVFLSEGRAAVHTGGGIVADSRPRAEWAEAEDKARVLLEALALLGGRGA
jgi:aminodeoxychorismate synthase component I